MSRRTKYPVAMMLTLLPCLAILTGCPKKSDEKPPVSAPAETPSAPTPADPTPPPTPALPPGVDDQDDPQAPTCLPKTGDLPQWVKSKPIRVAAATTLDEVMPADVAKTCAHFRIDMAARCAYTLHRSDATTAAAQVLVIEAQSPDDAFGLMSCLSGSRQVLPVGGETRAKSNAPPDYHCWQGNCYIHVWSALPQVATSDEAQTLLKNIAGRIPREDPPDLLDALPKDSRIPCTRWFLRNLGSLTPDTLGLTNAPDFTKLGELLGLGEDTTMAIASYEVPNAHRPNVVWVVRYKTPAAATRAHTEYRRHLNKAAGPASESTNLLKPHGRFLIGTWTVEEETLQFMMPRIRKLLP